MVEISCWGLRTPVGRNQFGADANAKENVQVNGYWIGILGTGALVISAFGPETALACKLLRPIAFFGAVSPDKSSIGRDHGS